jgi:hypothetical protein
VGVVIKGGRALQQTEGKKGERRRRRLGRRDDFDSGHYGAQARLG